MMNVKTTLLSMALLTGCILSTSAQSYYDDDIYYDASKDKEIKAAKAEAEAKKRAEEQRLRQQANFNPPLGGEDYAPADSYQYLVSESSTRDVDEYNRRNRSSLDTDSAGGIYNDEFAYTRRIERFHNNDIIADYNDPDLTEYYYSSQQESPSEVNIYINSPAWAWNSWYWPYRPWSWSYGWYSPWYWSSWDWYWGPTWSYYYPGCYWHGGYYPWGPSYHPGWGPGHGHHHAWQPTPPTPSGRRPVGVRNGYTGFDQAGRRPSSASSQSSSSRYGYGNYRPSSSSRVNNNVSRPSGSSQNNYGTTTGRRNNSSSYNNSYNNSSRNSSSFSRGGRSAGTRSSGGFSGGGNRGGGGGARGGRR